ncbi:hypothetical protein [Glycomyces sp. MUSA5-2]|uniref:hypothetical protein n=1 Tax=Glycomyces sp. MUSA5-2 TaxID=2053002 RepID=UPI003009C1C7
MSRTRRSLLLAAVCGGAAVVAAAGLWGGAPWRQVPFIVASTLIGAILPIIIDRLRDGIDNTPGPSPAVPTSPLPATAPAEPAPKRAGEPVTFVYDIPNEPGVRTDKRTGGPVRLFMIGIGALALAFWIDNSAAAQDLSVVATVAALVGFPLSLGGGIATIEASARSSGAEVQVRLDSQSITLRRRRRRVALRWSEIDQLKIDPGTGYLCASTTSMDRDRHRRLYRIIGRGAARSLADRTWRPQNEWVRLCRPAWLTSSTRRFFEHLETLSGHEIHNKSTLLP